jgi:hypothetical protein
MADLKVPAHTRQQTVAQLHEITAGYAGGYHEGLTRTAALARLAAISTDPDLLAEAAAAHAMADNWYAITAVDLLIEAGADRHLMDHYAGWLVPHGDG